MILAGTRSGHVCVLDLRTPDTEWETSSTVFRHTSSVAHVRSVGPYSVLAAGPQSAMNLYDIRFLKKEQSQTQAQALSQTQSRPQSQLHQQHQKRYQPWQQRPKHRRQHPNPRSNTPSDTTSASRSNPPTRPILTFPAYRNTAHILTGLDILTDPGYGHGLVAAAHDDSTVGIYSLLDGTRLSGGAIDAIRAPGVVRSLMWQTLPGDRHPSLFVGEGTGVGKYSFWA